MIKTFRGKLETDEQDRIYLSGGGEKEAYRIVKLQILPHNFNVTDEYNVKVFKTKQTTSTTTIDFDSDDLIAAAYFENSAGVGSEGTYANTVIFDNEVFNQDIFITLKSQSDNSCNYYLELEEIKIKDPEIAVVNYRAALLHGE